MIDLTEYEKQEQHSEEWFLARRGKITASQVANIIGKGRGTEFSKTGMTYIEDCASELFVPRDIWTSYLDEFNKPSRAKQRGTENEDNARQAYIKAMCMEPEQMKQVGFIPWPEDKLVGGSPDGCVPDENVVIEIKCPYTLRAHMEHLAYRCPDDLKKDNPGYYWQCIMNMMLTDAGACDFISYHPWFGTQAQLKVLRIPRNDDDEMLLQSRLLKATALYREMAVNVQETHKIIINYADI